MAFSTKGGVVVLTGAASGIGAALAEELATRGAALALVDRDLPGLYRAAALAGRRGGKVSAHHVDLSDHAATAELPEAVRAAHGRTSILVNNAGVALGGSFDELGEDEFAWLMRINFDAPVQLVRGFMAMLRAEPAAQIVNVSSLFGLIGAPGNTAYCSSKFAIRGFSEALRLELRGTGVGVSLVHPGGVATNIANGARVPAMVAREEWERRLAEFAPMLRLPPVKAAKRIADGIARREQRIVVGRDALMMATAQRLAPVAYQRMIPTRDAS